VGGTAPTSAAAEPGVTDPAIETELEALKARVRDRSADAVTDAMTDAVAEAGDADAK
jgi:hypothetical protein